MTGRKEIWKSLKSLKGHRDNLTDIMKNRLRETGALDMLECDQLRREIQLLSSIAKKLENLAEKPN